MLRRGVRAQTFIPLRSPVRAAVIGDGSAPAPAPVLASIDSVGFSAQWIGTPPTFEPDTAPVAQAVTRAGFTTAGAATTYADSIVITSRMRTPLAVDSAPDPTPLPLEPNRVSLSSYVYSDDTVAGVTNNSAWRSPKPIAAHAIGHRDLFQQTLAHEVVIAHRNARSGRQFACAIITVTDSLGATRTQTVATQIVSNRAGDQAALEVARFSVDTGNPASGGLANGWVKYDVKVFPWYGIGTGSYATNSILDSAESALNNQTVAPFGIPRFTTRYAEKRFNGWPICYVNDLGSASTSTAGWTLDGSTESNSALHFTTLRVACDAFYNAANTGVTGGTDLVGEIRLVPHSTGGTYSLIGPTASPARSGGTGALIVTKDPRVADRVPKLAINAPNMSMGNPATGRTAAAALIIRALTVVRSGTGTITTTTGNRLEVWFDNIDLDIGNNGNSGTTVNNSATMLATGVTSGYVTGMRVINSSVAGSPLDRTVLNTVSTALHCWALIRGVEIDNARAGTPATSGTSGYCLMASKINGLYNLLFGNYNITDVSGTVIKANLFTNVQVGLIDPSLPYLDLTGSAGTNKATGVLISQSLFEVLTQDGASFRISADAEANDTEHVIVEGLVVPTSWSNRRANMFYTDGTTPRTHSLNAIRGCYFGQFNLKSDLDAGAGRIGNWSLLYGTDCFGNVTAFSDAIGPNGNQLDRGFFEFSQQYLGLGSSRGTQNQNLPDAGFTDYEAIRRIAGVTSSGTGNGTYTLTPGSMLRSRVALPYRGVDIAGAAVPVPDNTGLYA